jgi:trehalose 6-phosphate synthase
MSFVQKGDGFDIKRGAGGLAGALDPVARRLGEHARWIATATSEVDRAAVEAGALASLHEQLGYDVHLLEIDPDTYADYYDNVSNRMLWFSNHCLFDELRIPPFGDEVLTSWRDSYEVVNRRFAEAAEKAAEADTLVLFQDYHLTTAPAKLREKRPRQPILHFTHSSFCGPGGLSHLPDEVHEETIAGLLGADLIGFHVHQWVDGFLSACERLGYGVDRDRAAVEVEGRLAWARAYPITVAVGELRKRATRKKVQRWAERFRSLTDGVLLVRADRAEPSKNIVRGFEAFEALLDRREDLRGRVHFVACLYPSRENMPEYQDYSSRIERAVANINGKYPDHVAMFMQDDFERTLGALLVYDVLVVNPLMDGMNLVAKEGPAINQAGGALVLSARAGAYEDLGSIACTIEDPYDVEQTARVMERAIDMDATQRAGQGDALRLVVEARKPEDWIESQIGDLLLIKEGQEPATAPW